MVSTERTQPHLLPEAELLLATAGGAEADARIAALARGAINWTLFLQMVQQERAAAVVGPRLTRLGVELPEQVVRELRAMATQSDIRMMLLGRRADETVRLLDAAGIPVMLLKGAALAKLYYGSFPKRPMLDIDLLVPDDRLREAHALCLGADWVPFPDQAINDAFEDHFHLPPLADGKGGRFNLELHAGLFVKGHPFNWPLADLWQRSRTLPDSPGRVPSPEDLMLHVVLHFAWSHQAMVGTWRSLRDVWILVEKAGIDWDRFVAMTRDVKGQTAAYWTLRMAREYGSIPLPAGVEAALRPDRADWTLRALDRHLAGQCLPPAATCPSVRLERAMWRWAMQPESSGHGDAVPWSGDASFEDAGERDAPEKLVHKLARHVVGGGRYLRYLHRVLRG